MRDVPGSKLPTARLAQEMPTTIIKTEHQTGTIFIITNTETERKNCLSERNDNNTVKIARH